MKKLTAAFAALLFAAFSTASFRVARLSAQTFPKSVQRQALEHTAASGSLDDRIKALNALFATIWEDRLEHDPEFASTIGDKRFDDRLDDHSVAAYNDMLARGRDYLLQLGAMDTAGMPDQEALSRDLLIRQLVDEQAEAEFKPWEMPVTQFAGIQIDLPQLVALLSFDSAKDYDNYIARLGKVPTAFDQASDDMMAGVADGCVPPKFILEKVLAQTNAIASAKPEDSPFARPIQKFPTGLSAAEQARIKAAVLSAIRTEVLPAYAQFARFLTASYIPAGRGQAGLGSIPGGDRYYAFLVRQSTTTSMTPAAIHQLGLDQVAADETQMLVIAHKLGFPDLAAMRTAIASDPKLHAQSSDQLLGLYSHYIDQMKAKLPQLFGTLPKATLIVQPVPAYMEQDQSQAYYEDGTPDGKRPGVVYVNLYHLDQRLLTNVESVSYHEGLPGHHLQISIAQELTGLPEFRKYLYYTAYAEGWGLYAEHLGKDAGFYQDPYSDYGRLEADEWRAIRLVVDTGVHSMHWTRQQMVDYFTAHSSMDDTNINEEVDRYIAWPAQALGYKIGQLEFLRLRAQAEQLLGPKFDIRAFHDEMLDSGALPMDVLEQRVDSWIRKTAGP
jgi:uncharacterized protein (DUF885 family)